MPDRAAYQRTPTAYQDPYRAPQQVHSPLGVSGQQNFGETGRVFDRQEPLTSLPAASKILFGAGMSSAPCPGWRFADPRPNIDGFTGIVAFYYPDYETAWDKQCHASFLGNFYDMQSRRLRFRGRTYRNAEAAFQSLKYPSDASQFEDMTGTEAFEMSRHCRQLFKGDLSYSGFTTNWNAMFNILKAKFDPHEQSDLATKLDQTGDAFLLEHNDRYGRDSIWSDNEDGSGQNWLGLQLMLVRAWNRAERQDPWSQAIHRIINPEDGTRRGFDNWWQNAVSSATRVLKQDPNMRSSGQGYRSKSHAGGRSPQTSAGSVLASGNRLIDSRNWR